MTIQDLHSLMAEPETPHVEFKEARGTFSREAALKYLCAFANEGGGKLILGVTNKIPRETVGSVAFRDINALVHNWKETLGREILVFQFNDQLELFQDGRRVLVLQVEGRLKGEYVTLKGTPWVRDGESLVQMSPERMRQIALEPLDVSARFVPQSSIADTDPAALGAFRAGLVSRAMTDDAKGRYASLGDSDLLQELGLASPDGMLSTAALLLVGRDSALQQWVASAEVIFEKRRLPTSIRFEARHSFRRPLLLGLDEIVSSILPYTRLNPIEVQDGASVNLLSRFPERSIRESVLNAVAHRDYTSSESVLVQLSEESFVVTSPGSFPGDVTPENVADRSVPRNRLLAEMLEKCGLIERSGQGVDLMMLAAVRLAQSLPAFEEPESRRVRVTLSGRSDAAFFAFARQLDSDLWESLSVEDFRTIDAVRRRLPASELDPTSVQRLLDLALFQRTRGGYLSPSDRWLKSMEPVEQRTLSIEGLKDRIVGVLNQNEPAGLSLSELAALFPDQNRRQLQGILQGMRGQRVTLSGRRRYAKWHAV